MRRPSHRAIETGAVGFGLALVAAKLTTPGGPWWDVLVALCVLAGVSSTRWRLWWLERRVVGRRVSLAGGGTGTVVGLLRNQPGVFVHVDLDNVPLPPGIKSGGFFCPLGNVTFGARDRWRYWLPARFDSAQAPP